MTDTKPARVSFKQPHSEARSQHVLEDEITHATAVYDLFYEPGLQALAQGTEESDIAPESTHSAIQSSTTARVHPGHTTRGVSMFPRGSALIRWIKLFQAEGLFEFTYLNIAPTLKVRISPE